MALRRFAPVLVASLALAGCGSAGTTTSSGAASAAPARTGPAAGSSRSVAEPALATGPAIDELHGAQRPVRQQFPAVAGRSLRDVAAAAHTSLKLTAATDVYTPGLNRFAFGLSDSSNRLAYAPSAVYVASSPDARARGPFLAPADPLFVARPYRSAQNDPDAVKAVYASKVPLSHAGVYAVLVLTRTPRGMAGSSSEIAVVPASPMPAVGQRPPAIATDTLASVHGNLRLLSTRVPPDDMHAVPFDRVLGKRPVALLFSTPELCVSRVCGPVTDIMVQLEHQYSGRIEFIHEEVYVGNDPSRGLRPQLKAFHLETEPWLYTVNAKGTVAARLDGAFGAREARAALEAALR